MSWLICYCYIHGMLSASTYNSGTFHICSKGYKGSNAANVIVLWLFFMVPLVGLQCVIVVFPDNSHLLLAVEAVISPLFSM